MKKASKIITLLLVLALLTAYAAPALAAGDSPSYWAAAEVASLSAAGVVPQELLRSYTTPINRGEFTALIVLTYEKITGSKAPVPDTGFNDISFSTYKSYIAKAYGLGIISGVSENAFDPDAGITRQEAAKLLFTFSKALGKDVELSEQSLASVFPDSTAISRWAVGYVGWAYDNGLMKGVTTGFDPLGSMTREQAMVIIQRLAEDFGFVTTIPEPEQVPLPATDVVYRALSVGISDYANDDYDGERFKLDAQAIYALFSTISAGENAYSAHFALNVLEGGFRGAIQTAFAGADDNDVSIFTLSGHGLNSGAVFDKTTFDTCQFILSDGSTYEFYDYSVLVDIFKTIPGIKILLIGNCYSGGAAAMAQGDDSLLILTASEEHEKSHGIVAMDSSFTYNIFERAVLDALQTGAGGYLGADANLDGAVTFTELAASVRQACLTAADGADSHVQVKNGVEVVIATN